MRHSPLRVFVATLGLTAATVLAGCASAPSAENSYAARLEKLEADCKAREGSLTATGRLSAEPQADYVCTIHGPATRLNP